MSDVVDPERGETAVRRADRNWAELLSELRVVQTGVTILFSLLLTVPFSTRFHEVTAPQRVMYLVALLLAAASAVVLVAPVPYHRVLFRQRQKAQVVTTANRLALVGLGLLALALTAVLLLVLDVVVGRAPAVAVTAVFGTVTVGLWFGPATARRLRGPDAAEREGGDPPRARRQDQGGSRVDGPAPEGGGPGGHGPGLRRRRD